MCHLNGPTLYNNTWDVNNGAHALRQFCLSVIQDVCGDTLIRTVLLYLVYRPRL